MQRQSQYISHSGIGIRVARQTLLTKWNDDVSDGYKTNQDANRCSSTQFIIVAKDAGNLLEEDLAAALNATLIGLWC